MRPHRASAFADAVPFERGPGRRTPATLLALDERDRFLREAAQRYCVGLSSRAAAAWLHVKLARYRESAWRRDRVETLCPPRPRLHTFTMIRVVAGNDVRDHA